MNTKLFVSKIASFMTIFAMILSLGFVPSAVTNYVSADHDPFGGVPQTSVFFCHAKGNGEFGDPNSSITATGGQIDVPQGHAGHDDDIIPPFHFDGGSYPGQNWTEETEDIWDNGTCEGDGVVDPINTPPVLVGNDADGLMTVNEGDTFTDPGAVCTDAEDNPEPAVATGGDEVDTSTPGEYVITYDCTDTDGATATQVTLTVTVVDMPECSDNKDNADQEDTLADELDPGCWTDPNDSSTYDGDDTDETDPTDVCTNILGFQLTLPANHGFASAGICVPDQCPNDVGIQTSPTECTADVCTNIPEFQATVPEGYMLDSESMCVLIVTGCMDPLSSNYNPDANVQGECNPYSCSDGIQNQNETEIDTGGVCTITCNEGSHLVDNQCVADSCSDGIQNQNETSVDEGGICAPDEEEDLPECSDNMDNDSDDETDFPNDPNCEDANDNDESGSRILSGGGIVNRGGGQVLGESTEICNWNTQFLRKGWRGNIASDVETMQNFLNSHMNAGLAVDKVFGPKTEAAVNAFQLKYESEVLRPWNISNPTGIWYISTTTKAKEIMCGAKPALPALINWSQNPAVKK